MENTVRDHAEHARPAGAAPLTLLVSLDVEEEGLFGGRYACRAPSVRNTAALERLAPLLERGIRPTLFCAHSVLADADSRRHLARLRDRHGAEIAAHLHHWNTPPLAVGDRARQAGPQAGHAALTPAPPEFVDSVPAAAVAPDLLAAKLDTLLAAGHDFQGAPLTSFRMGRWDLHAWHWPLLAARGVRCDASVRPLHCAATPAAGPDHFAAPADPFWVDCAGARILEAPLTVTPLFTALPGLLGRLPEGMRRQARQGLRHWGALALLPIQHPLALMRLVTRLHVSRGGRVLSLTWHSSELFPGGAPHVPDEATARRLMDKIVAYVDWLCARFDVRFRTHAELRGAADAGAVAVPAAPERADAGDWLCAARPAPEPPSGATAHGNTGGMKG